MEASIFSINNKEKDDGLIREEEDTMPPLGAVKPASKESADSPVVDPSTAETASEMQNPSERLKRSRERNRLHAQRTRQKKKQQMQTLQTRADELKQEQVHLKQSINEKNTASILVGLFATAGEKDVSQQAEDPRVEQLLRRSAEDIPDASKITELPALILPGQHNSKKSKAADALAKDGPPDDGIDYSLLSKDRSKCTPEELDKIRRERNRMHAKRTRDRKRLFMEEMSDMCKQLEEENSLLRRHLLSLDGVNPDTEEYESAMTSQQSASNGEGSAMDQLKTLIEVAGSFEKKSDPMKGILSLSSVACSVATAVSADSNNSSVSDEHEHDEQTHSNKRRKIANETTISGVALGVPHSITAVGV